MNGYENVIFQTLQTQITKSPINGFAELVSGFRTEVQQPCPKKRGFFILNTR